MAVVGAGVMGAWVARHLQRPGARAVLIDAHGPGNSRSSSGDESRIIRMGYGGDEIYTRTAASSLKQWKALFAGEPLFLETGVLWLAHEGDPYPLRTIESLKKVGVRYEQLTTAELSERFPQFELDGVSWGLFEPESGVILARRAVQAVVRDAIRRGVEFLQEAVVPPGDAGKFDEIMTLSGQRISAENFVFACGPWLAKMFPRLLAERIHSTRQEVFYFGAPGGDRKFRPPSMPTWIDFHEEAYGLPDVNGRGVKIAIDRHGPPFDPDNSDRIASSAGLTEARESLARRLPSLRDAPLLESRVCQYENTSNGDFLIDRHPDFENVWLVGGGSGHGFKHGPAIGEYVAARIAGRSDGIEPRFSLESKKITRERAVY